MAFAAMPANVSIADTALPDFDRARVLETAREISDAELTDQYGLPFKISNLRGRVALVFFGFTNCPDVCPLAMEKFRQLHSSGKVDTDKVAFVFISVDGERDSPEVLKEYLAKFSTDFIGLTGNSREIKPIAKEFSASFFKGTVTDNEYSMAHSPQTFVLDQTGRLKAELYNAPVESMAGIIQALLSETID
jgi:cytochrome oxidase Cu insertion factor (SCO1/SenC/PrrC family)